MWDGECEEAFWKLKEICTSTPIFAYVNFSEPFKLHTNACTLLLGGILYQNQDGIDHGIGCASRSLRKIECKYLVPKLELLALKCAIMEQFHEYFYGNNFVKYRDNNLLTYVLTSATLHTTGHDWVASLANYNFTLSY